MKGMNNIVESLQWVNATVLLQVLILWTLQVIAIPVKRHIYFHNREIHLSLVEMISNVF